MSKHSDFFPTGGAGVPTYTATFNQASTMWDITHSLDTDFLTVEAFGPDGAPLVPTKVREFDRNRVRLFFDGIQAGTVTCQDMTPTDSTVAMQDWVTSKVTAVTNYYLKPSFAAASGRLVDDSTEYVPGNSYTEDGCSALISLPNDHFIAAVPTYWSSALGSQRQPIMYYAKYNRTTKQIDLIDSWVPSTWVETDNSTVGTYLTSRASMLATKINDTKVAVIWTEYAYPNSSDLNFRVATLDLSSGTSIVEISIDAITDPAYDSGNLAHGARGSIVPLSATAAFAAINSHIFPITFDGSYNPSFGTPTVFDQTFGGLDGGIYTNVDGVNVVRLSDTKAAVMLMSNGPSVSRNVVTAGTADFAINSPTLNARTRVPIAAQDINSIQFGADKVAIFSDGARDAYLSRDSNGVMMSVVSISGNTVTVDYTGTVSKTSLSAIEDDFGWTHVGTDGTKEYFAGISGETADYGLSYQGTGEPGVLTNDGTIGTTEWKPQISSMTYSHSVECCTGVIPIIRVASVDASGGVTGVTIDDVGANITASTVVAAGGFMVETISKTENDNHVQAQVWLTVTAGIATGTAITHLGHECVVGDYFILPASTWDKDIYVDRTTSLSIHTSGYTNGDTLTLQGGTYSTIPTTLTVTLIGAGGEIGNYTKTQGDYLTLPGNPVTWTGGTGTFNAGRTPLCQWTVDASSATWVDATVPDDVFDTIMNQTGYNKVDIMCHMPYASRDNPHSISPFGTNTLHVELSDGVPSTANQLPSPFSLAGNLVPWTHIHGATVDPIADFNASIFRGITIGTDPSYVTGYFAFEYDTSLNEITKRYFTPIGFGFVDANGSYSGVDFEEMTTIKLADDALLVLGRDWNDTASATTGVSVDFVAGGLIHTGATGLPREKPFDVSGRDLWGPLPPGAKWLGDGSLEIDFSLATAYTVELTPLGWGGFGARPKFSIQPSMLMVNPITDVYLTSTTRSSVASGDIDWGDSGRIRTPLVAGTSHTMMRVEAGFDNLSSLPVTGYSSNPEWRLKIVETNSTAAKIIIDHLYVFWS